MLEVTICVGGLALEEGAWLVHVVAVFCGCS